MLAAVAAVSIFAHPAVAQDSGGSAGGMVAILDVAKVFKENQSFDTKINAIKAEADRLKATMNQQQEAIKVEAQSLGNYEVGSPERNELEAKLMQQQTALQTQARQSETELLNREARVYYETYQEMQSVVSKMAAEYKISLVLRFDSEQIDATNRAEVIKGVNRSVVYQDSRIDMTGAVIQTMNQLAQAQNGVQSR